MKNFVSEGNVVPMTVPYAGGVTSGDGVQQGNSFGVATADAAQGARVECRVLGRIVLPKVSGDNVLEGAYVYWDNTARNLTTTSAGNKLVGTAVNAAGVGVTTVEANLFRI